MSTCWIYRQWLILLSERQERLPHRLARHLDRCPNCQRFASASLTLGQRLAAEAPAHYVDPSPFLRDKILAAKTRLEHEPPATVLPQTWRPAWPLALAILLLGLGSLYALRHRPTQTPPHPNALASAPVAPPDLAFTAKLDQLEPARLFALSQTLDQPLHREMVLVLDDARSAVQSLAQAFWVPPPAARTE
ncbi:MAG: hypothetical protein FJ387_27625 [Verrucomicrobia bacterium]|nr:hypothetical protein [Verrucomicrobiota bacterium]